MPELYMPKHAVITKDLKHRDYLRVAYDFGWKNSTDDKTKNGAVLVNDLGEIVSYGTNGIPPEIADLPERHERPAKYSYVRHAERDSIYVAANKGITTNGLTMYCPWAACDGCGIAIITSGIKQLITHKTIMEQSNDDWQRLINIADQMMYEAKIPFYVYDGKIGDVSSRINDKVWQP